MNATEASKEFENAAFRFNIEKPGIVGVWRNLQELQDFEEKTSVNRAYLEASLKQENARHTEDLKHAQTDRSRMELENLHRQVLEKIYANQPNVPLALQGSAICAISFDLTEFHRLIDVAVRGFTVNYGALPTQPQLIKLADFTGFQGCLKLSKQ